MMLASVHRNTRRTTSLRLIPIQLTAALAAVSVTGCADGRSADSASPVTLSIGYPLPASQTGHLVGVRQVVSLLSHEGLIRTGPEGRHRPRLAERWEAIQDPPALRLWLRRDIRLHDGSDLNAHVVATSLQRSRSEPSQVARYPMLRDVKGVHVLDSHSVEIRVRRVSSLLLDDLEVPITKRSADGEEVGAGPFVLDDESADLTVMVSNPHYYSGPPAVDRIELRTYPTVRTAWSAMMRGEIDFLYEVPSEAREFIQGESSVRVFSSLRPYAYTLLFNLRKPAFRSAVVRRALNLAVDRDLIISKALHGRGVAAQGHVWPSHWVHLAQPPSYAYDPSLASELLTQNGLPLPSVNERQDDRMPSRLKFKCLLAPEVSPYEQVAMLLQKQLYDIGVDMQFDSVSIAEFNRRMALADYDVALMDLNGGPGLVRPYQFWYSSDGTLPWDFGYSAADAALDAVHAAADDDALLTAVREFQRTLHDDPPAIFIAWSETARAVSRRFELVEEPDRDIIGTLWQWRPVQARDLR